MSKTSPLDLSFVGAEAKLPHATGALRVEKVARRTRNCSFARGDITASIIGPVAKRLTEKLLHQDGGYRGRAKTLH
jgi:hypothetical protein